MAAASPTQRTLKALRDEGWAARITERWNPRAGVRQDLFGIIDVLAVRDGETLGVQCTSGSGVSSRVAKVGASDTLPALLAAGWRVEVWGWRKLKVKRGGKAVRWACRRVAVTGESDAHSS